MAEDGGHVSRYDGSRALDAVPGRHGRRVIYLRDEAEAPFCGLAALLKCKSHFSVVDGGSMQAMTDADTAFEIWHDQESQANSTCLGILAEPASGAAAVCRILFEGWRGGPLPGGIAFLGYDPCVPAACINIADQKSRPLRLGGSRRHGGQTPPLIKFEWPPMIFLMPAGDRAISDCASSCSSLRAAGIPVGFEVIGPTISSAPDRRNETLVQYLDEFFDAHLTTYFPRMF